jgi:hypothetical protein
MLLTMVVASSLPTSSGSQVLCSSKPRLLLLRLLLLLLLPLPLLLLAALALLL